MCSVSNAPQTHTLTHTQPHTLAVSVYFANLEVGTKSANDASDWNRNRMAYRQCWRGSLDTNQYTQQSYRVCPKSRQAGQEASAAHNSRVCRGQSNNVVSSRTGRQLELRPFSNGFSMFRRGEECVCGERGRYRGLGAGPA